MIIISCEKENGWNDRYVVKNVESIEELNEMVKKSLPIEGYIINNYYHRRIIVAEELTKCFIYLNNYLNYHNISDRYYVILDSELDSLNKNQCKHCHYCESNYGMNCRYDPDEDGVCTNYKETIWHKVFKKQKLTNKI